jgi:hypothetical protein
MFFSILLMDAARNARFHFGPYRKTAQSASGAKGLRGKAACSSVDAFVI